MANWTLEQQAAIDLRNTNILVSAAAGSGKTAVLVERITRLILNKETEVDRMLVVTYTNAAAGEMRSRIEEALAKAIESHEADGMALHEQIKLLNRANIKTFHAFCLDIIRNHFQSVDLDPNFRLTRDTDRLILIEQALDDVLENSYEKPTQEFEDLVEAFSGNRNDEKLRTMIKQLYAFILSQPYPVQWLKYQMEAYSDPDHPLRAQWEKILLEQMSDKIEGAILLLQRASDLCLEPGGPEPYIPTFASDIQMFERLAESAQIGLKALELTMASSKFDRIASIRKNEKELYDESLIMEVKDVIRDKMVKKQIFEGMKKFFDYKDVDRYNSEMPALSKMLEELCRLTLAFEDRFSQLKRSKNLMDFNDLEHFAIKILEDARICEVYRDKFDYIFVDEYQDSSGIQETIVKRIMRKNNLFMVGDVKQSIYKFRLADPELFIEKYKTYAHFDDLIDDSADIREAIENLNMKLRQEESEQFIRIDLKNNFRTRTDILEQVNNVFEQIMSEKLGDVAYDHTAKLYGKMHFEKSTGPYVEVNLLSKKPLDDELQDDAESELRTDELEARAIAGKIKSLIGTTVYFPKEKVSRGCEYKDIVILLRSSKSWTPTFEHVFMEEGIPLYADSQTGYFDALEIKMLVELLKIIDNPLQDLSLLTVLRSPVVGLDVEEIAQLRILTPGIQFYYYKCKAIIEDSSIEFPSKMRLEKIWLQLEDWREKTRYLPLDELIWDVMQTSGYYNYIIAMPGGVARQANLKLLVDRATDLKNSKLFTLSHFIAFIEQMTSTSGDMGVASSIGEEEDVVRLMSIHKSKGLEFPIVIISGLGRKFNMMDTYGDLILHKNLGVGLSHVELDLRVKSKSLPQFVMKEEMKRETLSEEMRVLYVGLTRAVDRMILFATVNDLNSKSSAWERDINYYSLYSSGGFIDWIMPAIIKSGTVSINAVSESALIKTERKIEHDQRTRYEFWENIKEAFPGTLTVDEAIEKRLSFELPRIDKNFKPLKVSVSEKKRAMDDSVFSAPELSAVPEFLKTEQPLTSMEKGTAMHKVLERIDLSMEHSLESVERVIKKLRSSNILTEKEKNHLSSIKILSFLNTEMGIRLRRSINIHKERPFVLMDDEQLVQGVIDLYFEEEDGFVLIDYKTDYVGGKSLSELSDRYGIQLQYYKKAIETLSNKPVKEMHLYYFDVDQFFTFQKLRSL
ncbi:MAG: UvrD-helicase domain-containing protein [Bacillota bacterium]|nr:UvrD-helicase domain-containing protein [Bacillota bacterium]